MARPQIATGETAEDGCSPRLSSLSLYGVEDFFDCITHGCASAGDAYFSGSLRSFSRKPFWRRRQESQAPHGSPEGEVIATARQTVVNPEFQSFADNLRL